MDSKSKTARNEGSMKVLWKWTGVSAVIHALLIAVFCGFSAWSFHKAEAARKAKEVAEEAAEKQAAEAAAKGETPANANADSANGSGANSGGSNSGATASNGTASNTTGTSAAPATITESNNPNAPTPTAEPTPVQAEKVLGIDKAAAPEELPSSPFSKKDDDLLKDLK